jgi:hypothetical protein
VLAGAGRVSAGGQPVHDDEGPDVPELLGRMRAGDRVAAALFITRYGSRIRRRIRGKLNPAMRRIFDSQDILSTLGRRLDRIVHAGRVQAATEAELWALVFRMAENAIIDKARVFRRLRKVEGEDGALARDLSARFRQAERRRKEGAELEIGRVLSLIRDRTDRQIISLWLAGNGLNTIAQLVMLAPTAVRKRWQKIKCDLHRRLAAEARP